MVDVRSACLIRFPLLLTLLLVLTGSVALGGPAYGHAATEVRGMLAAA